MSGADFPYSVAVPDVLDLAPYQPGKPVAELERELGVREAIKLASNENPFGPAPGVAAAIETASKGLRLYPDASGFALKAALAERLGIAAGQITLGNGSNDVLDLLARIFVTPGDQVVYAKYAFLVYALVTRATSGTPVVVPARDWGHDLEAMAAAVGERTKLVFLANPNNPTGTWFTRAALANFLTRIPAHVVVVLDEAYCEYVEHDDYPDGLALLDRYPNLVVTRTFSKIHGLAGLRVGYAAASPAITDLLNRVRQPFNVNHVAQQAALAALDAADHVSRCRDANSRERDGLARFCEARGLACIPSVANFLSVDFGARSADVYQALLHRGIIVRPLGNYAMPRHLRITIGRPEEMRRLTTALERVLQ